MQPPVRSVDPCEHMKFSAAAFQEVLDGSALDTGRSPARLTVSSVPLSFLILKMAIMVLLELKRITIIVIK